MRYYLHSMAAKTGKGKLNGFLRVTEKYVANLDLNLEDLFWSHFAA